MQRIYLDADGKQRETYVEAYFAKRSKINEIVRFAEGCDEKGDRRSLMIYKPKFENINPVNLFETQNEVEIECYPLVVVWTYYGYIGGGNNSAFRKFNHYEV